MSQHPPRQPNPPLSGPVGRTSATPRVGGSWLTGALYSAAFYIAASLLMTVGDGFGGLVSFVWVPVLIGWAAFAGVQLVRRSTRATGYGMVGSVVVFFGIFWLLGLVLSAINGPA